MLTGDTEVTMGEAFVNGFSILSEMDQVFSINIKAKICTNLNF